MSKWYKSSSRAQHLLRKEVEMGELLDEECFEEALGYNPGRCTIEEEYERILSAKTEPAVRGRVGIGK